MRYDLQEWVYALLSTESDHEKGVMYENILRKRCAINGLSQKWDHNYVVRFFYENLSGDSLALIDRTITAYLKMYLDNDNKEYLLNRSNMLMYVYTIDGLGSYRPLNVLYEKMYDFEQVFSYLLNKGVGTRPDPLYVYYQSLASLGYSDLRKFWLNMCNDIGKGAISEHYLRAALHGLMTLKNGDELKGLALYAQYLSDTEENREKYYRYHLLVCTPLYRIFDNHYEVQKIVNLFGGSPFIRWFKDFINENMVTKNHEKMFT